MVNKMYYIVDGRGNYYQVNSNEELVVAENKEFCI